MAHPSSAMVKTSSSMAACLLAVSQHAPVSNCCSRWGGTVPATTRACWDVAAGSCGAGSRDPCGLGCRDPCGLDSRDPCGVGPMDPCAVAADDDDSRCTSVCSTSISCLERAGRERHQCCISCLGVQLTHLTCKHPVSLQPVNIELQICMASQV